MHKLSSKFQTHRIHDVSQGSEGNKGKLPPPIPGNHPLRNRVDANSSDKSQSVSSIDIYRYRKQVGVNLGACFVGERWISDKIYACCKEGKGSELSAVQAHLKRHGLKETKEVWEAHWQNWITDVDLDYLADHGINSIRIPIGWFSLSEPELVQGTDFADVAGVYEEAWSHITRIISKSQARRIGVLLDLHCLPGGQNNDAHSGTDNGKSKFYSNTRSRSKALLSVQNLIRKSLPFENVIGVQVLNEPLWGKEDFLVPFYVECLTYARMHGGLPLYIGDGWNLQFWSDWVGKREEFCVVDHHYYYCFTPEQHSMSTRQIIQQIQDSTELAHCSSQARGNIVIGEWSLALHHTTKDQVPAPERAKARCDFAHTQLDRYAKEAAGQFFWTYKFQVRNHDNEWDLRDMLEAGALPDPLQPRLEVQDQSLSAAFPKASQAHLDSHQNYWDSQGGDYEHWRYAAGFELGWKDALAFAQTQSRIGFVGEWTRRRLLQHTEVRGKSALSWEFEHGFVAGINALLSLVTTQ